MKYSLVVCCSRREGYPRIIPSLSSPLSLSVVPSGDGWRDGWGVGWLVVDVKDDDVAVARRPLDPADTNA